MVNATVVGDMVAVLNLSFFFFSSHLMMSKPYERYIQTFANLYVHTKKIHMQSTMDLSKIMYGAYKIVADMVVLN